ncbi:MAG: sugar ABC transporter permease [Anaerolineae bacterium]
MAVQTRNNTTTSSSLPVTLVGLLFLALGIAAFVLLVNNIILALNARAEAEEFGTTFLRFLDNYGIIVPLILIAIGVVLIRIGLSVLNRVITAAAWGRQLLLWMLIASVVLAVQSLSQGFSSSDAFSGLGGGVLWLLIGGVFLLGYWWLGNNMHVFVGDETLAQASSRTAWNLLLPTVIVLVLVAARPLEATFISSLTDERFASSQTVHFVGLNNYAQLLGIRFDVIGCTRGDDGVCATDDEGNLVFPRPRDVLDPGYQDLRFRDVVTIRIGESEFLVSGRDRDFMNSVGNTLLFTVISVTVELVLGIFIAMVINSKFTGRGLMRAAMLVPWAIPTVVSARLWQTMFRDNQSGVINNFFTNIIPILSSTQAWLANANLQVLALIAVDVWKTTPFMALILLAGLQLIPADIYEAADVDGANKARQFFQITLPLLRPTIAVALVFRTLDAVRVFDVFQVLLGRQKLSMATYNYETLVQNQQLGYASTIGVVIFVIILIFAVTYVRILGVNAE